MKTMIPDTTGARLVPFDDMGPAPKMDAKPLRFSPATLESDVRLDVKPQRRQGAPTIVVPAEEQRAMLNDLVALRRACG